MAQKAIRECDGKRMLARWLRSHTQGSYSLDDTFVQVTSHTSCNLLTHEHPWLLHEQLVVKPDQLIKRRGPSDLLLLDATWDETQTWIQNRMGKPLPLGPSACTLTHFIIEPFIPHAASDEYYLAIRSLREGDEILFHHAGGLNVGDVGTLARRLTVTIGETPSTSAIVECLLDDAPAARRALIATFIQSIFAFYADLNYAYLEMNPFVVTGNRVVPLDFVAKLDSTADFESAAQWGKIDFPPPCGREFTPEERYIQELDAQSGASLKLTVLNPRGRVWTMVAGGGASIVYTDTISDLGYADELGNYGEYSGDPSEGLTYEYARTLLDLMTRSYDPRGKVLIIGGGIANFTDIANTFKGIVRALKDYQQRLCDHRVRIYVRRGGPNYREGLLVMRELGRTLGVPIEVYGPETHITSVVAMTLEGMH